jgi:adenine/guanine phosphoribosyltransferase-like PRPP-binding protein
MSRFNLRFFNLIQTHGQDLSLTIPIGNIYAPIIDRAFPQIDHIGWRKAKGAQANYYTYIKQITAGDLIRLQEFLSLLHGLWVLTLTDHLKPYFKKELSEAYALDFNFEQGVEPLEYTRIGSLERQAKEKKTPAAVRELAKELAAIIQRHPTLARADYIVAMPARPASRFHLPAELVKQVGHILKRPVGLTLTKTDHAKLKGLPIGKKLSALQGKFHLGDSVKGKTIVVIDDLYQSGASAWSLAKFLKENGAREVYALACVKSWRDTDNQ